MEMHQVRYFLAVCAEQNFTRAAAASNVAQPSLTRAIRKLEDELGGKLFHRERNRTILTPLGRRVLPNMERLREAAEAVASDASGLLSAARETIRLGVMSTIAPSRLIGFLARLREETPELDIDLTEAPPKDILTALERDEIDAALLALPKLPPSVRVQPLYAERYMIAFPSGHPFGRDNAVPVAALDGVDYLKRVHCEYVDHFEALGETRPLGVNVRYSSAREDWVQAMVVAGLGCSIMPEFLPTLDGVGMRPLTDPEIARTVSLATVAGRRHGPALAAMVRLAARYPWPGAADAP